jgi:3-oxoisoapionate kinase
MSELLISYYGDDFTGSTDVMESLTFAGLRTILFLDAPSLDQVREMGDDVRAIGVAGRTRSMPPDAAEAELRPVFESFAQLDTPIVHYKTCSTFDSSPEIGSIGRAIDVGCDVFGPSYVPLVVGAPVLRRYCAFGNLFASSGLDSDVFRLDRHPTMSQHPTTPMDESDIRLHLGRQTDRVTGLVDLFQLDDGEARVGELIADGTDIVLFDTVLDDDLPKVGKIIWDLRRKGSFVAGSSGAEYALVAHWRASGLLGDVALPAVESVDQIAVASGSCSPVTASQIHWAQDAGFDLVPLDATRLVGDSCAEEIERGTEAACAAVGRGQSVIVHTGCGPDDPRIERTMEALKQQGFAGEHARALTAERIGSALGDLLRRIIERTKLKRVATTGGDTSYYVAKQMGVTALEAIGPMAPGSPLCRVIASGSAVDGCEMTFKGGQVGKVGFFGEVLRGGRGL